MRARSSADSGSRTCHWDLAVFSHDAFSDNRERLAKHDGMIACILELDLASGDHLGVDGTHIGANASFKSLRPDLIEGRACQ